MRRTKSTRHPRSAQVIAAVLIVGLNAACAPSEPKTASDGETMDQIAQQIQTSLTQQPNITKVTVVYQDDFTAPGSALVSASVKPGAALSPVVDEVLRLIWTSKLNPIDAIRVDVGDSKTPTRSTIKIVRPIQAKDKAYLDSKYGQHRSSQQTFRPTRPTPPPAS